MAESRQEECLAIIGVFTVLAFLFIGMRVWSRYLGRNFAWDDHLITAAGVLLLADVIATWQYILLSGTGYHIWDLPKKSVAQQVAAMKWNFSVQMLYHPLMGCIRASIIMFLFRMKDNRRRIRYSLHTVFWLNILYSVGTTFANIFQCSPVPYAWNRAAMDRLDANGKIIPGGKCIDSRAFVLSSCALSIFMDLVIIPIPSVMVYNLNMCRRTKILVVIVMSLGWIASATSVVRFVIYYYRFAPTNTDRTWNIGIAISIVEPSVHIITACAPATKCLFRYLFPSFGSQGTAGYYEDRNTVTHASKASKARNAGSRTSRATMNFNFGFGKDQEAHTIRDLEVENESMDRVVKEDSIYGMKQLGRDDLRDYHDQNVDQDLTRTRSCTRTSCTDASEPKVTEPKHCLSGGT